MKRTSTLLVAALAMLAAPAAWPQVLGSPNDTNFTGFTCPNGNDTTGSCQRSAAFTVNTSSTFTSRYAWNVNADTAVLQTRDSSSNARHNITFTATAPGGYRLDISTSRVGAMGRAQDASAGDGSADTTGVTGSSNIPLASGTLSLADPGAILNNTAPSTTSVPYSQSSGTATVFNLSNGSPQNHTLTFSWNGTVRSNSFAASVRQGEDSGTTTGCAVCGYPGNPSRTQSSDGHFVTVSIVSLCGNGTIDGPVGEACDEGVDNGAATSCCTSTCQFRAAGQECRPSPAECDAAETCTGSAATCPADAKSPNGTACSSDSNPCTLDQCDGTNDACQHPVGNAGAVCRGSAGDCDPAETCTGVSTTCPPDVISPNGAACSSDANPCTLDQCNGTNVACQHPAGNAGTLCRAAAGECDVAESCDGVSTTCPADAMVPSGTGCTPDANPCTALDQCDGVSAACQHPAGNAGSECRPVTGVCDVAEVCDGVSPSCPADGFDTGTQCRASAGVCDPAESCDGTGPSCPADTRSTAVCRAAAGACDVAESCDGVNDDCPVDQVATAGTTCRPAAATCDVAEACDGVSVSCPTDSVAGAFVECRPSAGVCDLAETCDGVTDTCPADAKSTAVCRAAAGACDLAESCDGVNDACPADALAPVGTVCRAAVGVCDVAEVCTGSISCPPDLILANGTPCNDGTSCTGPDTCQGGVCTGAPNADACADDFLCYKVRPATPFVRQTVSLADQFESANAEVRKLKNLCAPANKNAEGVFDSTTHLASYQIKSALRHVKRTNVLVENQIGSLRVDTLKADLLLVPSNKNLSVDPPAPNINLINVDHYKCYKVKVTPGTPKLPGGITVSVADQFNSPAKAFELRKPKHLCLPVDKNAEGIKNADAHLLCYTVKGTSGQPRHVRRTGVHINNQFATAILGTTKESELCIPSTKTLP